MTNEQETGAADLAALARTIQALCLARGLSLGLAESCTGGLIGAVLTDEPGSSAWFRGGIVAYHNRVKKKVLRVPKTVLRRYGAVSAETALAMARGARRALGARLGLAVTGIAGPGGATAEKPVGLVFIAVSARSGSLVRECRFTGGRAQVRFAACRAALGAAAGFIQGRS